MSIRKAVSLCLPGAALPGVSASAQRVPDLDTRLLLRPAPDSVGDSGDMETPNMSHRRPPVPVAFRLVAVDPATCSASGGTVDGIDEVVTHDIEIRNISDAPLTLPGVSSLHAPRPERMRSGN